MARGEKEFDDTNRGVLFPNDKGDNDARPDFTGNIAIDPDGFAPGKDGLIRVRLAGWMNKSKKDGSEYISITVSELKK